MKQAIVLLEPNEHAMMKAAAKQSRRTIGQHILWLALSAIGAQQAAPTAPTARPARRTKKKGVKP